MTRGGWRRLPSMGLQLRALSQASQRHNPCDLSHVKRHDRPSRPTQPAARIIIQGLALAGTYGLRAPNSKCTQTSTAAHEPPLEHMCLAGA